MKYSHYILLILVLILGTTLFVFPQAENVPANHSIYQFLKRMEVKKIISQYHDAVLPLSRKEIAQFILQIKKHKEELTNTEKEILSDFIIEFEYELFKSTNNSFSLFGRMESGKFFDKEKYFYTYLDSNVTLFVDGLLTFDFRRSTGVGLHDNTSFIEGGPRLRGSVFTNLGYYFQLTNAAFWGSRDVLRRDKRINQSFALGTMNSRNFDFVEGYLRYGGEIISAQIGRERVLWGNSYGDKIILSDYQRVFDAIRFDAGYKNFRYTFMHAWILGKSDSLLNYASYMGYESIVADKYFAAHRLELSLGNSIDLGVQEITIYSNRSVDLGYLNPVTFFESVQRSRQERDNGFLAFDAQVRPFKDYELQGTLFFDDINIPLFGTDSWQNRYAYQAGLMAVDPLGIPNTNFIIEYTRITPYMFSHNRSRENDYGSNKVLLGTQIGPNAESWHFRVDYCFSRKFILSGRFEIQNSGENEYDSTGKLIRNVGGDFLQPWRSGLDRESVTFLDGIRVNTYIGQLFAMYEVMNEFFVDARYEWKQIKNKSLNSTSTFHDFGIALRIDF
ncbi:MAG: capsule assembly Wzi family protein [Bacteroidota bacterium]|nr:capsule assembly Wzi family protein [Bacteroidota bacterium]